MRVYRRGDVLVVGTSAQNLIRALAHRLRRLPANFGADGHDIDDASGKLPGSSLANQRRISLMQNAYIKNTE